LLIFAFFFWAPYWLYSWIDGDLVDLRRILDDLPQRPKSPKIDLSFAIPSTLMPGDDAKTNTDNYIGRMFSIEKVMYTKSLESAANRIFTNFFKDDEERYRESSFALFFHKCREPSKLLYRFLYALLYLLPIFVIDNVYHGHFIFLGFNWVSDYASMTLLRYPFLGNVFLPVVAFCDISTVTGGAPEELHVSKLICEVNKHSALQYVFLLLWVAIFIGFILAPIDFIFDCFEFWKISNTKLSERFRFKNMKLSCVTTRQRRYLIMIWKLMNHDDILLCDILDKISAKEPTSGYGAIDNKGNEDIKLIEKP